MGKAGVYYVIGDQLLTIEVGTETGKAYMRNTDTFAWRLRQHRDAMKITQFEMCDRIIAIVRRDEPGFSLSYPAYNKMETGDTATPKHNVLKAIKEITGLSLDYLIAGEVEDGEDEFDTVEARQVGAMIDQMSQSTRQMMMAAARAAMQLENELLETQSELVELLRENIQFMENGARKKVDAYIDRIEHRTGRQ
jgi:transcriptional regulator with XRE-family HTH domain